ncbi:MAG: hypothetical protein HY294_01255 [Candidatus Rokubacteria bacterium]|nr:hypothetical protein [Candidatus Rokubacteria bacterium]
MARVERWTIVKSALACGVGAPLLGALVFTVLGLWAVQGTGQVVEHGPLFGLVRGGLGSLGRFWAAKLLYFACAGVLFGALGTAAILQKRRAGADAASLRTAGLLYGLFFGAGSPAVVEVVYSWLHGVHYDLWSQPIAFAQIWPGTDPVFVVIGMITGTLCGWAVGAALGRPATARARQ